MIYNALQGVVLVSMCTLCMGILMRSSVIDSLTLYQPMKRIIIIIILFQ